MRIIVIGAGIVGLTTAWWLARDGHAVTVVDRDLAVGRGTSFANGAQLSFSYVAPMASRAVLANMGKYLLDRNSPVRFLPRMDPAQWRWVASFLRACNAPATAQNTAKLLALSFASRIALHDMLAATPMQFHHARNGKLVVQSSAAAMADGQAQLKLQAAMGCEQFALTAAECLVLEPALESIAPRLVGGIHTPSEEVGDCHLLCQELHRILAPKVEFRLGTEIKKLIVEQSRVAALRTAAGDLEAELYILAAGLDSRRLISVPLQPIRGYSITARVRHTDRAPIRSVTDTFRKTVYAPLGPDIRVAGFAVVAGDRPELRPDRVASLTAALETTFPDACDLSDVHPWSGLRPATPTDVPQIGRSRLDNLLLNLGHGSLGFTLSAGSAKLVADIVAGRPSPIPPAAYAQ